MLLEMMNKIVLRVVLSFQALNLRVCVFMRIFCSKSLNLIFLFFLFFLFAHKSLLMTKLIKFLTLHAAFVPCMSAYVQHYTVQHILWWCLICTAPFLYPT